MSTRAQIVADLRKLAEALAATADRLALDPAPELTEDEVLRTAMTLAGAGDSTRHRVDELLRKLPPSEG